MTQRGQQFHSAAAHATEAPQQGARVSGRSRLSEEEYEELLKPLAEELSAMARWVSETNQRMVVVFEGRDTAGKGGSIEMFARLLNPRQCRIVALPSPGEREKTQWYFQRYIEHLPAAGEISLFDRSWYNRAGVEKVMGFCTSDQTQDFLNAAPEFERHLVDDGMLLFKYWRCCDLVVQEERFEHRLNNPTRRWKLSPIDIEAREHYDDYTEARELMLSATHTDFAPWTLVDFNDQPLGRLTLLRDLLDRVPDTELPLADIAWAPLGHEPSKEHFGVLQPIANYSIDEHNEHGLHNRHD
jgi:polyphosphate kinase 2